MNPIQRLELDEIQGDLLVSTAEDLIPILQTRTDLGHVMRVAFDYYSGKEIFQVQVIVTRHKPNFLDPFVTEEMSTYNKG